MQTNFRLHATAPGYANREATKPPPWHALVVWDTLLNNLSTGLFLTAAFSELAMPGVFTPVATIAYPVALVLLLADLVCLVLDLGDPWRFHHMLRLFKPSSPMSLGVWCLTLYSLPLTMLVAINLIPTEWVSAEWPRKTALILAILPAFGSCVYKGVLFSTTAQPGWRDARWLGGYFVSSAFVLGSAEILVLCLLMKQDRAEALLRPAFVGLLLLSLVPMGLLLVELRPALSRFYRRNQLIRDGVLCFGVGVLAPVCLLSLGGGPFAVLGGALCLFLGCFLTRFEIVMLPHAG